MATALVMTDSSAYLAETERERLTALEATITRGLTTFVEVGTALVEIRDARLYRESHETFEAYCTERWSLSRRRAYQLMDAASAVADLCTTVHTPPESERQVRPLTRLEPEQRAEAWREVVETAPRTESGEPRITAAHVENVVQAVEQRHGSGQMAVHYTSDSPEWYTPRHIINAALSVLGAIDLDPCSNDAAAPNVPARFHFTAEDDGLAHEWTGRVYMNPPYGDVIGDWTRKLRAEYEAGHVTEAVALLPARTDTAWFNDIADVASKAVFVRGRLKFSDAPNSAPFPSVVLYLGANPSGFARAFAAIGRGWTPDADDASV